MKSKLINPLGLLLFTPFFAMLPLSKAQAFCNQNTPFGLFQCPGNTGGHQDMTRNALPFLRTTILDDILDEHLFQDNPLGNLNIDYIHFDNSNFTGGVNYINNQYTDPRVAGAGGVIAEFDPSSPQPFDATDEFGQLLHTAQDFYSHTNWVDYNPANVPVPLFDSGTGLWTVPAPYGVVNRGGINLLVVQGNNPPPAGVTFTVVATPTGLLRLVNVAGHPSGATQGLVGGAYGSGNQAPPGATIGHGDGFSAIDDLTTMNKDTNVRTNYAQAYGAAAVQTETEWCRMLNLTASRLGFAGSSIPMALWVDPNGNPHPGGTACAISQGSKSVQVSIKSIKVLNDTDPFGAGELNFPFVLYRKDFTKSVRTEVNSISVSSGNFVPKTFLPLPLTLDLNNLNDLVITLQAWDDDDGSDAVFDNISIDPDDVLIGITDFFPGPLQRKVNLITPGGARSDLEVCLEIKVLSNLAPQQVESEGCLDFGDAPDSYKTLLESDGPRYQEGDSQRLGFQWDDEWDGQPTPLADGDDQSIDCSCSGDTDDEDGVIFGDSWVDVIFNIARPDPNPYQLRVWWDIDRSRTFEHPSEDLPPGVTGAELLINDLLTLDPKMPPTDPDVEFLREGLFRIC